MTESWINRVTERQSDRETERQRDTTNSISSLGKPSKNELLQPNNYKKVFKCVAEGILNECRRHSE